MSRLFKPRFLLASRRFLSTSPRKHAFTTSPAPPRLPPKEQEEFERLQRASRGAFSTPRPYATTNESDTSSTIPRTGSQVGQSHALEIQQSNSGTNTLPADNIEIAAIDSRVEATRHGEELHPDIRRGAKPEFEGDINPATGEVGGPKNEPLRWGSTGSRGDWSYNGRVTDF